MSYEQFYGVPEQPFSNAADARFFYESPMHSEAMVRILHGVNTMKGLVVMVGEMGAGKTLLARKLLDRLQTDEYEAALLVIVHTEITADWFLRKVAVQLGVAEPADSKNVILTQLYNRLMEIYEHGRKAVVIIDEANMLQTKEIFEEMRGLLNLEVPGRKLMCLVLMGLPDLEKNLMLDPPLMQRTAVRFTLKALDPESTANYIKHRLAVVGCTREIFPPLAAAAIYQYSKGIPRLINTICDNCLLEGYLIKKEVIPPELVEQVAIDLGLKKL